MVCGSPYRLPRSTFRLLVFVCQVRGTYQKLYYYESVNSHVDMMICSSTQTGEHIKGKKDHVHFRRMTRKACFPLDALHA